MPRDDRSGMSLMRSPSGGRKFGLGNNTLPWVFVLYAAATLLHFAHNAEYLTQYPHLPPSWSRADVYAAWGCVTLLGLLGYALYELKSRAIGLTILGLYAILGFFGLLHYTRAPMAHHTAMMNVTIWAEAVTGALLLANVVMVRAVASRLPTDLHRS